jgi:hypothetical protein
MSAYRKDAAVMFMAAQSNGLAYLTGTNIPDVSLLPNVFIMETGTRTFVPFRGLAHTDGPEPGTSAYRYNLYRLENANLGLKANPLIHYAIKWQALIDSGSILPDLYIIGCAEGAQSISEKVSTPDASRWNPEDLRSGWSGSSDKYYNTAREGVIDRDAGLLYLLQNAIHSGLRELHARGLTPRILGCQYLQGEKDAGTLEAYEEFPENFQKVVQGIWNAADMAIPIYPVSLVDPSAGGLAINDAFANADLGGGVVINSHELPSYDGSASPEFGCTMDGKHYHATALAEIADAMLAATLGRKAYGDVHISFY